MAVRRPSILTLRHQQARQILCISCRMACLGVVPMAAVFRTPLSRRIEPESSWQALNPGRTPRLQQQQPPGRQPVGAGDPAHAPAQMLMDLMDKLTTLLTVVVEPADKSQHDAEVARVREEMVQAKENIAAEETRMVAKRAALDARAQQLQA